MANTLPPALAPLTVPRDALRPPSADNRRLGLGMSVAAHALLITALTLGVQWRTDSPEGVTAELWAATPQIAAPPRDPSPAEPTPPPEPSRPVPPPPKPLPEPKAAPERPSQRDADIATEKAERERKEKERREKERKDEDARKKAEAEQRAEAARKEQDKAKERAAEAQREASRQEQMRRMQQQLGGGPSGNGAPGSTGTAARDAGPSANYAGRIKARIKPNIVLTEDIAGNPVAEVEVKVAPDGTILGRRIVKPSGVPAWDEVVLRAIDRTQVLPRDTDGRIPATMVISFKPQD